MERNDRIFEAALRIYFQFGLQKANVQEIADAAGVSKKTLYNHFDGKEDLFDSTIEWHVKNIVGFYDQLIGDESISIPEKLIAATDFASKELSYKHSMVSGDMLRINRYLNEKPVLYIRRNIQRAIISLIEEAKREGICKKEYPTETLCCVIFSMIYGLLSWDESDQLPISMTELFDTTMNILLNNLLTEKGKSLLPIEELTHHR